MARNSDAYDFTMAFVAASDRYRSQYIDRWQEILASFIVQPTVTEGRVKSPYTTGWTYQSPRSRIVLKDPETHKLVMTYASKLVRSLFGDPRFEYIQAKPTGWEDAPERATTVTRLLKYAMGLPGTFRTMVEAVVDMLLFGTSVVEVYWKYEEREMPVRSLESAYGVETSREQRLRMPVYDDVVICNVDVNDFYPDPSNYRMQNMVGAAKRFRMNAHAARRMADQGVYDKSAVSDAISMSSGSQTREPSFRVGLDQPEQTQAQADFRDMIGYEYWGETPFMEQDEARRVITVLNGVVVRNDPYPLADPYLPFHAFTINPIQGRFYGLSPAEVVRYTQSMADAMMVLLTEAVIRDVHPPIAVDQDADLDIAALKRWRADDVIVARGGVNSVGTIRYQANIPAGMQLLAGLDAKIQESSGALGGIQGEPGPDREAATVGAKRLEFAMDRPELAAMILERDTLPMIGSAILRRYQQFLNDTSDLTMRIGEQPASMWLGDIMGDYDIQFIGSRMAMSRQTRLQGWDRIISMASAVPAFQVLLPTIDMMRRMIGDDLEMPDVAAKIGDPQQVMLNMLMSQLAQGGGGPAQNGVAPSPEPAGALPAQMGGGPFQP